MKNFADLVALMLCLVSGVWAQAFIGADAPFGTYLQPKSFSNGVWSNQAALSDYRSPRLLFATAASQYSAPAQQQQQLLPSTGQTFFSTANDFRSFFPDQPNNLIKNKNAKEVRFNRRTTIRRRLVNEYDRVLKRYLETLYIDTVINTLIQPILHRKLVNVINLINQETHQPILYVKRTKPPTSSAAPEAKVAESEKLISERTEPLVVVDEKPQNIVLPPIIEPAVVEKVGYDGNSTQVAVPPPTVTVEKA